MMLVVLFTSWLTSLETIRIAGRSLYSEINGADSVQMDLFSHAALTFAVGIVTLFDMIMGYKLIPKIERSA